MADNQDLAKLLPEEEERKIIVDKYEKGREKIKDKIDDWEDPTNEIYHVTDRYGFIHDHHLPDKLTDYESKIRALEVSRTDKWLKMFANWLQYYPDGKLEKLRNRVYKGIPNQIRGKAWLLLLDVEQVKKEQQNRYKEMLEFGLLNSTDIRQIDLDVNRTFRNNVMFRERYNTKQQELFRVLVAYSVYNSEIGYCQGMSQIAALLLMYMSEEDAFWAIDRLMSKDKYAMHGFFIPGFPKLVRFANHHDLVLKRYLPKVYKHFKKFDIDSTLYTLKWFFQCFLDRVPFSLTLRLWDAFMIDGEVILTCMSYTLLKLHKRNVLRKGMEESIEFLQVELEKDFGYHDDQAMQTLQQSITELKKNKMHLPKSPPKEGEKPTKPFGILLEMDNLSIRTGDNRSLAGSIIIRNNDNISAQSSRTSSIQDVNDVANTFDLENVEVNDFKRNSRPLSLYDNVDVSESIEAAKRLSSNSDNRNMMDNSLSNHSIKSREKLSRESINVLQRTPMKSPTSTLKDETFENELRSHDKLKSHQENNTINHDEEFINSNMNGSVHNNGEIVNNDHYLNEIKHKHDQDYVDPKCIEYIDSNEEQNKDIPIVSSSENESNNLTDVDISLPIKIDYEKHIIIKKETIDYQSVSEDTIVYKNILPKDDHLCDIIENEILKVSEITSDSILPFENEQLYKLTDTLSKSLNLLQNDSDRVTPSSISIEEINEEKISKESLNQMSPSRANEQNNSNFSRKTSIPRLSRKKSNKIREEKEIDPNEVHSVSPLSPLSPTSPTNRGSLIPRIVPRSQSSSAALNSFISSTATDSSVYGTVNVINQRDSYIANNEKINNQKDNQNHNTLLYSDRVRIHVPYGKQTMSSTTDSNKIVLRVNTPTKEELTK